MSDDIIEVFDRESIRKNIFSSILEPKLVEAFGTTIEVKSSTLGAILAQGEEPTVEKRVAASLINACVVPGTNTPIFEKADVASILALPYNADLRKLQKVILEVTILDVEDAEKN